MKTVKWLLSLGVSLLVLVGCSSQQQVSIPSSGVAKTDATELYGQAQSLVEAYSALSDELEEALDDSDVAALTDEERDAHLNRLAQALVDHQDELGLATLTLVEEQKNRGLNGKLYMDFSEFANYTGLDFEAVLPLLDELAEELPHLFEETSRHHKASMGALYEARGPGMKLVVLPAQHLVAKFGQEEAKVLWANLSENDETYLKAYLGSDYHETDGSRNYQAINSWIADEEKAVLEQLPSFWTEDELTFLSEKIQDALEEEEPGTLDRFEQLGISPNGGDAVTELIEAAFADGFFKTLPLVYDETGDYVAAVMVQLGSVKTVTWLERTADGYQLIDKAIY